NLTYRDNVGGTNFGRITIDPTTTLGTDFTADSVHILSGDTLDTNGYEMDVAGTMDIDGTLDAAPGADGRSTINVRGIWDNAGLFISTTSTVIFDSNATSTLSGNTTFYRLFSTGSTVLDFAGSDTYTFTTGGS